MEYVKKKSIILVVSLLLLCAAFIYVKNDRDEAMAVIENRVVYKEVIK